MALRTVRIDDGPDRWKPIGDLAHAIDSPGQDPIAVSQLAWRGRIQLLTCQPPVLGVLSLSRLHLTLLVQRTGLQHGLFTVPLPREVEAGKRFGENRPGDFGVLVRLASVDGHV